MSVSQSQFRDAMMDAAHPAPEGLTDPQGRPAGKRFDVYRNNVAVSLTEAMETGFPVIRKLVGDEFFKAMTGVYLRLHQPETPMLMHYGETFPGFLERFEPVRHLPYLADVARLELAIRAVYHAADAAAIAPEALQALPGGDLMSAHLTLAPALALVRSQYPIHAIWLSNTSDDAPTPDMQAQDVLVTRPEYDPIPAPLPMGGAAFVEALIGGRSFGQAHASAIVADPGFDLTGTLGALISGRAIVNITPGAAE